MKKTMASVMALGLAAAVAYGQATEVKSVNVVGFAKKSLPAGGTILTTCNFDPIGGGTNTLLDVFGTDQLKQHDVLATLCDRVILWDPTAALYQTWSQRPDGLFYKANSATEFGARIEGNPEVPAGTAMWIKAGSGGVTKDLAFMGEVVMVATQEISIVPGQQLVAYPFSSPIPLQDMTLKESGKPSNIATVADKVVVWDGTSYQTYGLKSDRQWYKANNATEYGASILATNVISIAEGFWYKTTAGFTWSEANPYIENL